ncbi:arginine N-methyltransferase (Rmt2), putative [Cordyceps militaris CM01]|uniref:Arginine N-methyltransferase 2 n=1 Tax=Cordyceps militaris (strain CM01) TaxID=983644 RepID=G3JJT5_CORMM|nr:arginine N-methyltransferase (Rmt2), putative [Cordyceps militaris CM01]EGX92119.1 arginine N-methyltransferase (Rmt2), putative [Cordyceps militaris CM01]
MPDYDDALEARIPTTSPDAVRELLLHAWSRDLPALKTLLAARPGAASEQDPTTGETPLHAVVRGCGPAADEEEEDGGAVVEEARACIQELFYGGAIWNDVDNHNETPGCTAARLGQTALYRMFVEAGVRAEMLFGLMNEYEQLSSAGEDEDEEEGQGEEDATQDMEGEEKYEAEADKADEEMTATAPAQFVPPDAGEKTVTSDEYLQSTITYDGDKLLDDDLNGVMMAWETDIMQRSVASLLPPSPASTGPRILNIGFGMGIIDGLFAAHAPSKHHIIEAHPGVLSHVGETAFGAAWEARSPAPGAFQMLPGKWQDVVPTLVARGELYDAIYFDTFGEDYAELRTFFTEHVPVLLDMDGRFGFFNGLGADRRVCYDVYAQVVEMHASEAGLDVEWETVEVDMSELNEDGKGAWEGVRRRYWTLDSKFLDPPCYCELR